MPVNKSNNVASINYKLTTSTSATNATNIQIKLSVEDSQQLER